MDRIIGSKKHKAKLTGEGHRRNLSQEKASSKGASSSASSLRNRPIDRSAISLEPLDLRGNFFSEDDYVDAGAASPAGEIHRSGFFGHSRSGYAEPSEQFNYRESMESSQPTTVSTRHSRGTPEKNSDSSRSSRGTVRSARPDVTNVASKAAPVDFSFRPQRQTYNRAPESYTHQQLQIEDEINDEDFDNADISDERRHGYGLADVKAPSLKRHVSGTTTLASPRIGEGDAMIAEKDPFDRYYDTPSTVLWQRDNSRSPPPKFTSHKQDRKAASDDAESLYSSEYSDVPPMDGNAVKKSHKYTPAYRHSILKDQLAEMTFTEKRSQGTRSVRSGEDSDAQMVLPIHKKQTIQAKKWYRGWSTRSIILLIIGSILTAVLAIGLGVGLFIKNKNSTDVGLTPTWRPAQGTTWNIQLSKPMSSISTPSLYAYNVYDIDLFDNNATTIAMLHKMGRRVICYFSAGTYESWRPDASKFPNNTIGTALADWPNERWIDTRDNTIRAIMTARIDLAYSKGCDGIDPDNVDGYNTNSSFPLSVETGVDYMNYLAKYAHESDIAIGLKNAPELINGTLNNVDWELNESCAKYNECEDFQPFIQAGKPVLHIEYSPSGGQNATLLKTACTAKGTHGFSTLVKRSALDYWSVSCPIGDTTYGGDSEL